MTYTRTLYCIGKALFLVSSFFISTFVANGQNEGTFVFSGMISKEDRPVANMIYMKFAIVDAQERNVLWKSSGDLSDYNQPPLFPITIVLDEGRFSVEIGNTSILGMMNKIDTSIFDEPGRLLRVWVGHAHDSQDELKPPYQIPVVPYAVYSTTAGKLSNSNIQLNQHGLHVEGQLGVSDIPSESSGTKLMWYPGKAAIRAGTISAPLGVQQNAWSKSNIGKFSTAFGYDTLASGFASSAIGYKSEATGLNAVSAGLFTKTSSMGGLAAGIANFDYSVNPNIANSRDIVFSVGNGGLIDFNPISNPFSKPATIAFRHNALTLLRNGHLGLNENYPLWPISTSVGAILDNHGVWYNNLNLDNVNFIEAKVNEADILDTLMDLNIYKWHYPGLANSHHYTPSARDFNKLFHIFPDQKVNEAHPEFHDNLISSVDLSGVSLLGVQALNKQIKQLNEEIKDLKTKVGGGRMRTYSIPAAAFQPIHGNDRNIYHIYDNTALFVSSTDECLKGIVAPITLPEGAVIRKATYRYRVDNSNFGVNSPDIPIRAAVEAQAWNEHLKKYDSLKHFYKDLYYKSNNGIDQEIQFDDVEIKQDHYYNVKVQLMASTTSSEFYKCTSKGNFPEINLKQFKQFIAFYGVTLEVEMP